VVELVAWASAWQVVSVQRHGWDPVRRSGRTVAPAP
jgi:hypothetical protein